MLSRTADHLYWMSRYVERAENTARFLDVANNAALSSGGDRNVFWRSVLSIAGGETAFKLRFSETNAANVVSYTVLDPGNQSSVYCALRAARENAHAVRSVIPNELWEAMNTTWLDMRAMDGASLREQGLVAFCEWVRERSHLFRGIVTGVMLRDEPYHFLRLGTALERADNTARMIRMPAANLGAGGEAQASDSPHWAMVLRALSSLKAYRTLYRTEPCAEHVVQLLVLRDSMPRSLHACLDKVMTTLSVLGPDLECTRMVGAAHAALHWGRMEDLLAEGLEKFVKDFLASNNKISARLHEDFLMSS